MRERHCKSRVGPTMVKLWAPRDGQHCAGKGLGMQLSNLVVGVALASLLGASASSAETLYSNGPISGKSDALTISGEQQIGDSFILTSPATITGVTFGSWVAPGETLTNIDWGITDALGVEPRFSTSTVTEGAVVGIGNRLYDIRLAAFSTGHVSLAAGAYYLWLSNAVSSGGSDSYWDINDGPSTAYVGRGGVYVGSIKRVSQSFQIYGIAGGVPEPTIWVMMLAGFAGLGAAMRFKSLQVQVNSRRKPTAR